MKPALLLVDFQNDFLNATGLQPTRDRLVSKVTLLLRGCRQRKIPVIYVTTSVHKDPDRRLPHWKASGRRMCVVGTEGHRVPQTLQPLEDETVVHKVGFNAFASGDLDGALKRLGCDAVLIAGLHLHTCVRGVATEGLERGLQIFIVEDAVASHEPVLAAATRRWLSARCVTFVTSNSMLSTLDGYSDGKLAHRSPRELRSVLFDIPVANSEKVNAVASATRDSWKQWRQSDLATRCRLLEGFATRLEKSAPRLVRSMGIELGKPVAHGAEEVRRAVANIRDVVRRVKLFRFELREPGGIVRHEPIGVIALISPWNNPVAIPAGKIAPALLYANTVVWKPAPAASRIAETMLECLRKSGVPEGAVQLLHGDHITAQNLAANENVDAVTITGSSHAGFALQEICARRVVPLQAELSGNNAAIVGDDADLSHAAAQIAWGAFGFAGQRCTANRRVIVRADRFEALLTELKHAAGRLVWGDPLEPGTEIGPVIHAEKREEHAQIIADAHNNGGVHRLELTHESRAQEQWVSVGAYAQPVIACCDEPDHPLVQEETMSPLLVVQRAIDFDHALTLSNGVRHGLAAALFTQNTVLQEKFLSESRAGILRLNTSTAGADITLPFGGWKASGIGPPEHGVGDSLFYTRMQAVYGMK